MDTLLDVKITERELNVLELLSKGYTNNEISEALNISIHTTKAHLESLYYKLKATNRIQAVMIAIKSGIIKY